ncbi:FMN-linked oxidoreductase [Dothidotthia symphoricarpi CBS 119687]|uniref:Dihydroorotate dehydrogenase (fumarate) n=1 Tax=Dothidotthia symphoricarpi CBS 119687 TaxID=1392245 RepID=A0A6A6AL55_9PLEO|nr:FMN-linked oxidoreductase [Dothidotthia symphoricarpi CBS 119687]KAF2131607.1 FMN-linked oxidoreductase [Dothidotthia symphoricarpi CBS 119687]
MAPLNINPPLLNSANPWCTSLEQLQELYSHPQTGAVTTRTSLLEGFPHDPSIHQFTFYNPTTHSTSPPNADQAGQADETGSLNTLGYSPLPLAKYLSFVQTISDALPAATSNKPFIISVTGSADDVVACYRQIAHHQRAVKMPLAMEVNLSCPNIKSKPPPAYSSAAQLTYLTALKTDILKQADAERIPVGIKTPPFTYHDQFQALITALLDSARDGPCPIGFITATNTLGSSLLLGPQGATSTSVDSLQRVLESAAGTGIGGLAGAPLHPLALGNVYSIRQLLDQHEELKSIQIIGVGGVEEKEGYRRMRAVGAAAVGVGTALGRKGVKVFEEIGKAAEKEE